VIKQLPEHKKMPCLDVDNLAQHLGLQISQSGWVTVSQPEVDAFARVTRDPDPLHVDPGWAREESPYGHTIMAGFNTLSLLPYLVRESGLSIGGVRLVMNYGFERIRFISSIAVGQRFRNTMVLKSLKTRADKKIILITSNTVEAENAERPAMTADWINILWR